MAKAPQVVILTLEELRAMLAKRVKDESLKTASEDIGVDGPTLWRFVTGDKEPPPRLMRGLNLKRDIRYILPKKA